MEILTKLKYTVFVLILLMIQNVSYGKYNDDWHSGVLVLQDQQVLVGHIAFDQVLGLVLIKEKETIKTYTVHNVASFRFYDKGMNVNRKFVVNQNEYTHNTKGLEIFEVVVEGRISVLRKVKKYLISTEGEHLHPQNSNIDLEWQRRNFKYFVKYNNKVVSMHKFETRIFPVIEKKMGE